MYTYTQAEEKRELQRERGGQGEEGESDEGVMEEGEEEGGSQPVWTDMVAVVGERSGEEPPADSGESDVESETNSVGNDDTNEEVSTCMHKTDDW